MADELRIHPIEYHGVDGFSGEEPVPCSCWIGRGALAGWAPDRQNCPVHGDLALAMARTAPPHLTVNAALDELVALRQNLLDTQRSGVCARQAEAIRQGIEALRGVAGAMREIEGGK